MTTLFDPIDLRGLRARNRIWVSPMCQYSVDAGDGVPTEWHLVHLGSFARGGAGLVFAEASGVTPEGRISPHDTGIWSDAQVAAWRRITAFAHTQGALIGLQLAHAGRKASVYPEWGADGHKGTLPEAEGGWQTVSASALAFGDYAAPRALTVDEIRDVVDAFVGGARRALDAGFDLVEIHAAHGYLIHQFLSPLSNLRDDAYGGSLENRARLLLEIVAGIRAEVGDDVPVFVRFSATDYVEGGWDERQTATVAGWARDAGADLFDISSGGLVTGVHIPSGPGYQVPLAESVAAGAHVRVSAVGRITEPRQAAEIVSSGQADAVMLGREMLRDPHFALRAATELGFEVDYWPPQYLRARP
ncbi:NADH:flavin oxidoreductase/NADH oxidase [Pseudolysinimonas yzui]|uniref:Oxidoreductase n=1 Tax=Pseudolysinimonas yzui TaxID=2708254 RepID=A0A8J3M1J3_9MICO|nr:NADH:flavin oxidoreductase/NADH oxidase [Pseudolysinimonas yzui]GHF17696.1 oxidoreductase [Pseudolysinimonas yzui]